MEELKKFILTIEETYGLPKFLLFAIIQIESSWRYDATRYEDQYRWLWDAKKNKSYPLSNAEKGLGVPPKGFSASFSHNKPDEYNYQRTSWGLTQVMGAVAREIGYSDSLPRLATEDGSHDVVVIAGKLLSRLKKRYNGDIQAAIAAYNAGSARVVDGKYVNQAYVDKVNAALVKYNNGG